MRRQEAAADMHRVLAVVRGTAVGAVWGEEASAVRDEQKDVLRRAAEGAQRAASSSSKDRPPTVLYAEVSGTGNPGRDLCELEALGGVYAPGGAKDGVMHVGCAKAALGHLGAASGMVGLLSALLVLQHRTAPPLAGLDGRPQLQGVEGLPIALPRAATPLRVPSSQPLLAAVSSLSVGKEGGVMAHVLLEEPGFRQGQDVEEREPLPPPKGRTEAFPWWRPPPNVVIEVTDYDEDEEEEDAEVQVIKKGKLPARK
jgi:6-methylsalicylic acid synthase